VKVVTVVGARPQFVKAAAVSRVLRATPGLSEVLVHTGQHYDPGMSQIFFDELEIPAPDHHLGVGSAGHGVQTGRMLIALEPVLEAERPDWVMVYGDTNSTLAGTLAAVKLHLPVAHVEAGLRSYDHRMPEEINRVLTDHASQLLFAPTQAARANLAREGVPSEKVRLVGDVMLDAALWFGEKARKNSRVLSLLGLEPKSFVLATVHRAENTDHAGRFAAIVDGLAAVSSEIPVVLPIHPRARALVDGAALARRAPHLRIIDPVGYLDMVALEQHAALVATDSGGVQKEAFFYRVPCVTLREQTEWVELVELGWNVLAPPVSAGAVLAALRAALARGGRGTHDAAPYGDGHASLAVRDALLGLPTTDEVEAIPERPRRF